ncbi:MULTISPECIES: glycerophosphodiester phosphodiesterase [Legionella]|uniref:glycerophosphodiester phosphodiesterase n=1 Tax=Legionella TaxID=445 RepID=UPI000F8E2C1F|nr:MULTISPECIES: glycerophosphodiester phosphodiesterase [Legionella]MCP0914458.1 glycerophosphodiester phosphodiesterase [Legionella sp. 27cVA30]RUQ97318.1 glycerophosphodiester phosphodiesterase [Legionella septentrionalis]RUR10490.1 glycerophosphodiester phosphodiesterase [Legionella septentrionalis]RUR16110.1 glycerophosphodiester phosphodiesterase [Legionella septentrionalis]
MEIARVIAHRGASAYTPENTMAAFNKALSLGSRFIEFDVMLSEDGDPFIFHDDNLERTTNGRGEFGRMRSEQVRSLDAGTWFSRRFHNEKIPSLQETLQWFSAAKIQANIEIKPHPGQFEPVTIAVLSHLNQYWPSDLELPLLSSFDRDALYLCRSIAPEIPLALLLHEWQDNWLQHAKELQCMSVNLNKCILTKARVAEIKQQGYKVYAYTVNHKRQALKLFAWGVDAVFSDYPDLLS